MMKLSPTKKKIAESLLRLSCILLALFMINQFFYRVWNAGVLHKEYDGITLLLPVLIILLPIIYFKIKKIIAST